MITGSTIYWITRLDALSFVLVLPSIIGLVIGTICFIIVSFENDEIWNPPLIFKRLVLYFCVSIGLAVFVPTTKEMAAIIIIPRIANNQNIQELGGGLNALAKEWLEELRPEKKGDK